MSLFKDLVNYINSLDDSSIFSRQELISYVGDGIDVYRKGLCNLGYIERVGMGAYKKIEDIQSYITSSNYRNPKMKKLKIKYKLDLLET